ncbi:MAG: NADPH-dependent 7-cyano-7-deazaguanine reductase QueF [Myxococcales bacterium]|nr:NADPH-dependent 7-cyano-7-deazaguanine reductase QueF [Myxococcales bacterium]USN51507.1 MAG: NADPH-dependent 7-cyano-7-deazaguanine reductase QueF [Myxococcales bacterium]
MKSHLQKTVSPNAPLGHKTAYPAGYDKSLLYPVKRDEQRQAMGFPQLSWQGVDIWNAYELAWLNLNGIPQRVLASFYVPADSLFLAESKSVKLYLNSLNHERFESSEQVKSLIEKDLSEVCQSLVKVLINPSELDRIESDSVFKCIDQQNIEVSLYQRSAELLSCEMQEQEEKLVSHVFKSHCLVTGQPDWGSIFIHYRGNFINHDNLLRYLVSYSQHSGFSENCIEQIFVDILERCKPSLLTVFGRFTRRGGIDINPYRTTHEIIPSNIRLSFQ